MSEIYKTLPKAELHLHIEGTLEPMLMFELAKRNKVKLAFSKFEEVKQAYNFNNLQEFLNIYYKACSVLQQEQDFYDLTYAYFERANQDNVVHSEIFFDPQTHLKNNVSFDTVINGIHRACQDANAKFGITSKLIMCFLRDLSQDDAIKTLELAKAHKEKITAVGLDSAELNHPPSKFKDVFLQARNLGFLTVAHAGEEAPAEYIWDAINNLKVDRIDHGIRAIDDKDLIAYLEKHQLPLTVCPLSNVKLKNCDGINNHPIKKLLEQKLCVCVNSDDPAYFGGYVNANFKAIVDALDLSDSQVISLVKNSFLASFLDYTQKHEWLNKINDMV